MNSVCSIGAEKVLNFFNLSAESLGSTCLSALRVPAGQYDRKELNELIDSELVEFDTRTGISCQQPEDWDVLLSDRGIELLRIQ